MKILRIQLHQAAMTVVGMQTGLGHEKFDMKIVEGVGVEIVSKSGKKARIGDTVFNVKTIIPFANVAYIYCEDVNGHKEETSVAPKGVEKAKRSMARKK